MMNDFAACLLMELEKWMLNASPAMINMGTWLDSAEFAVPVSTLEEVQKRLTSDEVCPVCCSGMCWQQCISTATVVGFERLNMAL
jgi:hypothetical protein